MMRKIVYNHDHLKGDYPQTVALLDELMDIQLIDNTGDEAADAWTDMERAVIRFVPPLERKISFLEARVKLLEKEIDQIYDSM
jgi:hypothetical protein